MSGAPHRPMLTHCFCVVTNPILRLKCTLGGRRGSDADTSAGVPSRNGHVWLPHRTSGKDGVWSEVKFTGAQVFVRLQDTLFGGSVHGFR